MSHLVGLKSCRMQRTLSGKIERQQGVPTSSRPSIGKPKCFLLPGTGRSFVLPCRRTAAGWGMIRNEDTTDPVDTLPTVDQTQESGTRAIRYMLRRWQNLVARKVGYWYIAEDGFTALQSTKGSDWMHTLQMMMMMMIQMRGQECR